MKEILVKDLKENFIKTISDDWMLITAGNQKNGFNTMTASWGGVGALWAHNKGLAVTTIYIRPQRYTKEFVDKNDYYTLSFFDGYKKELAYLGAKSGRDENKIEKVGFNPEFENSYTYFKEARLVLVCKKLYCAPIVEEGFIDKKIIDDHYPNKDYHYMYIGEIVKILEK